MGKRLAFAFALSGAAALIYESAWARWLRLAFGGTSEAHATVLAVLMGGLAIGSWFGGRLADRLAPRSGLRLYVHCELGVGALAVASLVALRRWPELLLEFERIGGAGYPARLAGASLLLLPPCVLMGMTLPLLGRACVGLGENDAHAIGRLYAANTVGAVAGALATGFVLLAWLGVSGSILVAALFNGLAAWIARGLAPVSRAAGSERTDSTGTPVVSVTPDIRAAGCRRALLLFAAALSGACALGLEVLWDRTLALVVGSSTHAFALMLGTFLAGIAAGSACYARFGERLKLPLAFAAHTQLAIAAASVLLLHLAGSLPYLYVSLWGSLHASPLGLLGLRILPAAALMSIPAVMMGASLPALACAVARGEQGRHLGGDVGAVYAANTAGGVLGAWLAALVLLPALGVARASSVVALASVLAGIAIVLAELPRRRPSSAVWILASAAAVMWTPPWEPGVMGKGLSYIAAKAQKLERAGQLRQASAASRVIYYHDGAESSVLVYDHGDGTPRQFVVNGRHEATTAGSDMRNQYLLGHLPAILHRGPVREGLVIALGSGMTAGCLARHAEHVTVVELERSVIAAARTFAQWNHGVVDDARVTIVVDDGRHHLLASPGPYDVITVDPIHPSVAGSDALYSVEQYELVRRRLSPGGVAAQWLPLYEMGIEDARAIACTFREAFPDAQIWINGSDAILIGGAGADPVPAARIRDALARPEVASSLAQVHSGSLGTFVAGLALTSSGVDRYVAGAHVLRDDRPELEFSLPWKMYERTIDLNLLEIYRFSRPRPAIPDDGLSGSEREQIRRSFQAVAADQIGLALSAARHEDSMVEFFKMALEQDPDDAIARAILGM